MTRHILSGEITLVDEWGDSAIFYLSLSEAEPPKEISEDQSYQKIECKAEEKEKGPTGGVHPLKVFIYLKKFQNLGGKNG